MRQWKCFRGAFLFLLIGGLFFQPKVEAEGTDILLHVNSQRFLNFTSDQSSLYFTFPNFRNGSVTNEVLVNYTLSGNDVSRMQDLLLARLDLEEAGLEFQARMSGYSKTGGNATLTSKGSDFIKLTTQDTGLADKTINAEDGKILEGTASVIYRVVLRADQAAGQHYAVIVVTFADN